MQCRTIQCGTIQYRTIPILLALVASGCAPQNTPDARELRSLARANDVANWLDAHAEVPDDRTAKGLDWVVDVDAKTPAFATNLYSGTPGIILFYLEHHHVTGRPASLGMAREGARRLRAKIGDVSRATNMGLYTGVAGWAFTFAELWRTTQDPADRAMAVGCLDALEARARAFGDGCEWSPVTDIISGTAGVGLGLLHLAEDLGDGPEAARALRLATRAGNRMLEIAKKNNNGAHMRWLMSPRMPYAMPNFSHGTAGVAFFLARLHGATKDAKFLASARAGGDYLLSITDAEGLVYHDTKSVELDYLGWCHGPPGTARLFTLLHELTGGQKYRAWIDRAAAAIHAAGVPGKKTPGFWNNHGQCCGTAGVADFFMSLPLDAANDAKVDGLVDALAASGKRDADGLFWTGAEHRVRPQDLTTQTGYTQGAAGIGLLFLHDVARRRGAPRRIVLPDACSKRM